jgi:hypothetical protein
MTGKEMVPWGTAIVGDVLSAFQIPGSGLFGKLGDKYHELERYMRCKDRSQVRGYAYKRSHLVALRRTKISASDPPSTWWAGER